MKEEKNALAEMQAQTEKADKEQSMHCRRCRTVMKNGVCPKCGFRAYVPLDGKKIAKIRLIAGGICLVIFFVIFFITRK